MKNKYILISSFIAACLLVLILFFCFQTPSARVNNDLPADELISKEYSLKQMMKLDALGRVYLNFSDSNVYDLAEECDIKLECKRQTGQNTYYYIVEGSGFRCFLFADENDILTDIIFSQGFLSQQKANELIEELDLFGHGMTIDELSSHDLMTSYSLCCSASGCDFLYFPLSDGMMIMRRPHLGNDEPTEFFLYGNEEIAEAKEYWKGQHSAWNWSSEILEIDRAF